MADEKAGGGATGADREVPPPRAPKTFLQTLQDHHYGFTADEATKALQECIQASERTGKATELVLKLKIKPESKAQGRYSVMVDVNAKLPAKEREAAVMFVGPNGDLQTKDPRQNELEGFRVVDNGVSGALRVEEQRTPGVRVA
mgnify:CR=1 FL=1